MNETDFQERYEFVVGWLQRRSAHLAAAVMRLGRVCMGDDAATDRIQTRAMAGQRIDPSVLGDNTTHDDNRRESA